jgi:hypothetical protein
MLKHRHLWITLALAALLVGFGLSVSAQTATPLPLPTLTYQFPTATPAFCITPLAMSPGSTAFVRPGANIRSQPTLSSPLVNYRESSTTVTILGGPICADGLNWWQVRAPGEDGWVAESFNGVTLLVAGPPDPSTICADPLILPVGTKLPLLNGGVRVRAEPNLSGLVLTVGLVDTEITILDGPICADAFNWWKVELVSAGVVYQGWIAEGFAGDPWLEQPGLPSLEAGTLCAPPMGLRSGTRAYVNYNDFTPKNLRSEAGLDAPILFTLIDGVAFTVIGGPVCVDNLNWWQIQIITRPDVVGWFAEGGPGDYWIRRIQAREIK